MSQQPTKYPKIPDGGFVSVFGLCEQPFCWQYLASKKHQTSVFIALVKLELISFSFLFPGTIDQSEFTIVFCDYVWCFYSVLQ